MMISDINKIRKERKKKKRMGELEKRKKIIRQENIIKDKNKKNKEAYQETQLVNIEAEVTLEGKVDIKKLLEIAIDIVVYLVKKLLSIAIFYILNYFLFSNLYPIPLRVLMNLRYSPREFRSIFICVSTVLSSP